MSDRHDNRAEILGVMRNEQPKSESHLISDPGAAPSEEAQESKTILIVEDNELNMQLFNDVLEVKGYQTLQSRNGLDALKIARESKPDLILMDIQLPGISGLDVAKSIKEDRNLKTIPIIALTAFAMKGDEEKIRQGGCEDYLAKPISTSGLLEIIEKYL